jgi:hypothetical protein
LCPIHFRVFCGNGWDAIEFSVYSASENPLKTLAGTVKTDRSSNVAVAMQCKVLIMRLL